MASTKNNSVKRTVKGAGGVVVNPRGEILLVRYPTGSWAFPKGHIETGESLEVAAVREVMEEGGAKAKIVAPLGTTEYTNTQGIRRLVYWYAMRTKTTQAVAEPGFGAAFVPFEETFKKLSHAQNRQLLKRALVVLGLSGAARGNRFALGDKKPQVHASVFVAPGAQLIGDVTVKQDASIWFNAVLRGDVEQIVIGEGTNIQDGAILHADPGFPCVLGRNVTVGHRAVVHGAKLEDGSMVGMGAIVLNGANIGRGAVVGAGAVVPENMDVPSGALVVGVPAKLVRQIDAPQNASHYTELAKKYLQELTGEEDASKNAGVIES